LRVLGAVRFQVDDADLSRVGRFFLNGAHGKKDAGTFARFEYPGYFPIRVDDVKCVADLHVVLLGVVFVDDDLVVVLGHPAGHKTEFGHAVVLVEIDACVAREEIGGLLNGRGREGDVRELRHFRDHFLAHGGGAEADGGAVGRPDHDVGADSAGAGLYVLQCSFAEADESQNHGDLESDGGDGEECSDGPVLQVFDDESVNQALSLPLGENRAYWNLKAWENWGVEQIVAF
jgi:hypothetical protein